MRRLLILLILVGGLVLMEPISRLIRNTVGNIIYRGAFVTGIITADNGDKSYAVEIGESGKSRLKVFTLSPDPDLKVGDKARILYRGGNKEDPILLAPTITISGYIFVYCWTAIDGYCIKSYTSNGVYINTFPVQELQDWNNVLAVDVNNNVYCVNYNLLKCYDKDGNLLSQKSADSIYAVCVGPDGYIYDNEYLSDAQRIVKRSPVTLDVVESKAYQTNHPSQGFIMDSNKNIYLTKDPGTGTAKFNYNNASPLPIIAYNDNIYSYNRTLAIVNGVLAIGSRGDYEIKTADLNLNAYINENLDITTMQKPIGIGNIGNDFILCGYDNANQNAILGRYLNNGTKVWETIIGTINDTTPYQIAAYPF